MVHYKFRHLCRLMSIWYRNKLLVVMHGSIIFININAHNFKFGSNIGFHSIFLTQFLTNIMMMSEEIVFKIARSLCDVMVVEKMHDSIVEICEMVTKYLNSHHWVFQGEIAKLLNYVMSSSLDENNAHDFFEANWMKFHGQSDAILHEIGTKMLAASHHGDVYWYSLTIDHKELDWFILYYTHHAGRNNMEE